VNEAEADAFEGGDEATEEDQAGGERRAVAGDAGNGSEFLTPCEVSRRIARW
jgi:hypothetical protein